MKRVEEYLNALFSMLMGESESHPNKGKLLDLVTVIKKEIYGITQENNKLVNKLEQLEQENDWLKAALDSLPNPIFLKNERGEFVYFNSQYGEYFDIAVDDFLHKTVLDLEYLDWEQREKFQKEDMRLIYTGQEAHYISDFPNEKYSERKALYWSKGFITKNMKQRGLLGEIVDISMQERLIKAAENELEKLAVTNTEIQYQMKHDRLTGLYNRHIIDDFIHSQYIDGKWISLPISILLLDIDHFKRINDNFGHTEGDRILREFSKILEKSFRDGDLLIRYGGEEFLIVTLNDKVVGGKMAERIRADLERQLILPDQHHVTVSIGVAELLAEESFLDCVNRADHAMYCAKNKGRNCVVIQ